MPAPQTIGDLIAGRNADASASAAASNVAVQANSAASAAASVVVTDDAALAGALKSVGDTVIDNGDGTFTGYFADTSPLGYHTEVLKGGTAQLPAPIAPAAAS